MKNPEKLDHIGYSRRRKANQKHNTICVGHHCAQITNHTKLRP